MPLLGDIYTVIDNKYFTSQAIYNKGQNGNENNSEVPYFVITV